MAALGYRNSVFRCLRAIIRMASDEGREPSTAVQALLKRYISIYMKRNNF
jgi:hypothetical protein